MERAITKIGRAKINLALHVVGQRADSYHLLDSLVVFANYGDKITVKPADRPAGNHQLTLEGPFSNGLEVDENNLVLKAAQAMGTNIEALDITLEKNLPVASGIGGGSADAAATLLAISELLDMPLPGDDVILSLGADVPVCVNANTARMSGIGETVETLPSPPTVPILLVNPGVGVSTPTVFKALTDKNKPIMTDVEQLDDIASFINCVRVNRNDLQLPACSVAPEIQDCLDVLGKFDGVLIHRMSGSGATCFALFADQQKLISARDKMKSDFPDWWVVATEISAL